MKAGRSTQKQNDALLSALMAGPMTSLQALDQLGIARCAARVHELRESGWGIDKEMVAVRNRNGEECRVAEYRLASNQRQFPLEALLKQAERRAA